MGGILLQNGKQAFTDANSRPLAGGRVYFYQVGTQTPKDTYQDSALTILNTNPIILDARGEATIYGSGAYRQVLKDASLNQIWDQVLPDLTGAATQFIADLQNTTDPTKGSALIPTVSRLVLNIATLRTLPKTGGSVAVFVQGYYAAGDGGGGHYYLDTSDTITTDNSGSVIVATDGGRWKLNPGTKVSIKQFGAKGDSTTDDTAAIQKAVDYVNAQGGYLTTLLSVNGGYVSQVMSLEVPRGMYKLTAAINSTSYLKMVGDNAFFIQADTTIDILSGVAEAYQYDVSGINFLGGRHQIRLQNNNIDVTRWTITRCTFSLAGGRAVYTFPTAGATSHLSANLTIKQCAFYNCRQVLLNYCDSAIVEDCWVRVDKANFTASTPVFENGSLTCDGHPNLYLINMFGVPVMGTQGGDRLPNVRWVDMFKGSLVANRSRFGGEGAGMPNVYWFAKPATAYPFRANTVTFTDCECFGGPSAANDSAIISMQGQIPNRISIVNCAGPTEVPYVIDSGTQIGNLATYFSTYESTSGQKAYDNFHFEFRQNDSLNPNGVVYAARVPLGMRIYTNGFRGTKVSRSATSQTIGSGSNLISFDTLGYDSQGAWSSASPTVLTMPAGASKMMMVINFTLTAAFTGILNPRIETSAGTLLYSQDFNISNSEAQAMSMSALIDGTPGDGFRINLRTTASGAVANMTVTMTSLDYIG